MSLSSPDSVDISARVRHAVAAAKDRKAVDLRVLHLGAVTDFTDYFLFVTGNNPRQVRAIAEGVERSLRDLKVRPLHVEGMRVGSWVLLDFGDFVVHVFEQLVREHYGLERLWADAPDLTAEFAT